MTKTLDLKRPYINLDGLDDPCFVMQDGVILSWSESNVRYEHAWWLQPDGTPIPSDKPLVKAIVAERPFDPAWILAAASGEAKVIEPRKSDANNLIDKYEGLGLTSKE